MGRKVEGRLTGEVSTTWDLGGYKNGIERVKADLQREGWVPERRAFKFTLGAESYLIGLNWPMGGVQFVYQPKSAYAVAILIGTCARTMRRYTK